MLSEYTKKSIKTDSVLNNELYNIESRISEYILKNRFNSIMWSKYYSSKDDDEPTSCIVEFNTHGKIEIVDFIELAIKTTALDVKFIGKLDNKLHDFHRRSSGTSGQILFKVP